MPILVWAGSALLGWVAGELIATEPIMQPYLLSVAEALGMSLKVVVRSIEVSSAVLVVVVGWAIAKASARRTAGEAAE
jgi:hypothetical protein